MNLGLLTNSLSKEGLSDLVNIAEWASSQGFTALETGPSIPLDEKLFETVLLKGKVTISNLIYCRNYLSTDKEEAGFHIEELKKRIVFSAKLGIPILVTSTGIDKLVEEGIYDSANAIRKIPARSLEKVVETFLPIIEAAETKNVRIAFENCPLMGNIAISPVMWEEIFFHLQSPLVGLCYDASHLLWQFIDPYTPIQEFKDKIFHVHAKDTFIDKNALSRSGILTDFNWWHYRIPGAGQLDWKRLISCLKSADYTGVISIEHEDAGYEGNLECVQEGLIKGLRFMEAVIHAD
jgi:sugar phosphate isomerase/epimerase